MARYLLIEVDSNATADRMRAQIDNAGEAKGIRVVGMFTRSTQLCDCVEPVRHQLNKSPIDVRGSKFGWLLCPRCLKPRSTVSQTLYNLLDDRRGSSMGYKVAFIGVSWVRDKTGRVTTWVGQNLG
jgi:hypothetical protein